MDHPEAVTQKDKPWQPRGQDFDARAHRSALLAIFEAVRSSPSWGPNDLARMLAQYPQEGKGYFSKIELVAGYRQLVASGELPFERHVLRRLQMKPMRTASGVAPVTVLTKPAGCPGHCIFCPDDDACRRATCPTSRAHAAPRRTTSTRTCRCRAACRRWMRWGTRRRRWSCWSWAARGARTAGTTASGSCAAAWTR